MNARNRQKWRWVLYHPTFTPGYRVYTANQQSYIRDQRTNLNQYYQDQTENKQIDTILFDGEVDVVSGDPVYLGPEIFQRRNSIGVQWKDVTRRARERLALT